jgi:hypothetical protein
MAATGAEQKKLTSVAKGAEHPSWGPAQAGRSGLAAFTLAFIAYSGDGATTLAAEIMTMRGDGSEQQRLTRNEVEDTDPAWFVPGGLAALGPGATPARPGQATAPVSAAAGATRTAAALSPTPRASPSTPAAAASAQIVVDDRSPQFTRGGTARYWKEAGAGYNGHMFYTSNSAAPGDNWGRWTPLLPRAGSYEVFAYVPAQNATTRSAAYTIVHDGKSSKQTVSQLAVDNAWVSLGVYRFAAGGGEYVQLSDVTGEPQLTRSVGFDAVSFVWRGP